MTGPRQCAHVGLTWDEIRQASSIGCERNISGCRDGREQKNGVDDRMGSWEPHVSGAIAEMALAKLTRTYWSGTIGKVRETDVGALECRFTRHRAGRLIVKEWDKLDPRYVLAVPHRDHTGPDGIKITFVGWMTGHDVKARGVWRDDWTAWTMVQDKLHPMELIGGQGGQ